MLFEHHPSDLNFDSGAKVTGEISILEKIYSLPVLAGFTGRDLSETDDVDWFDREGSAEIVDVSKWNGDIDWRKMWNATDGIISRLGYGTIMDQRFLDSVVPGYTCGSSAEKYKAVYHYMNTIPGSVSNQIDLVLRALDLLGDNVHAFWSDAEAAYNDVSSAEYYNNPLAIMRAVRAERPDLSVGFYTNYEGWKNLGYPKDWLDEFLFWYAWYPYNFTRYPNPPLGLTLADIYMWQNSADGNGLGEYYGCESGSIDVNTSRDQTAEFLHENMSDYEEGEIIVPDSKKRLQLENERALMMGYVEKHSAAMVEIAMGIEEEEVEPKLLFAATVSASSLNKREGPGVDYDKVGSLPYGSYVEVFALSQGTDFEWAKLSDGSWVASKFLAKI